MQRDGNSKQIMNYDYIQIKDASDIIGTLYERFVLADKYVATLKNGSCFKHKLNKIDMISQIPKPVTYDTYFFPKKIQKYIDENATYTLHFSCKIKNRQISVSFVIFDRLTVETISMLNQYVYMIYMWIHILDEYSTKKCSKTINLFVYLTPFKKILPDNQLVVLEAEHINTGYTTGCKETTEIILYRSEEWFKVFIHETFHNFGLDFSDMNLQNINTYVMEIFNVNVEYNLYESYCETWARIINVMFYTFLTISTSNKQNKNKGTFITLFNESMCKECIHSLSQCLKVLNFMDLNYNLITSKTSANITTCNILYKERTSVFSYYVITGLLMNNYTDFITWCNMNNPTLLRFDKTHNNLDDYIDLIDMSSKNQNIKRNVTLGEKYLIKIENTNELDQVTYKLMNSLRMTTTDLPM